MLRSALTLAAALFCALGVAAGAQSPLPPTFGTTPCPTPITKANVDALISPEIQGQMRQDARDAILRMPGCFRGTIAGTTREGRFFTNDIETLRAYLHQTAGVWHREDALYWIDPAGDRVPMMQSSPPPALIGTWNCTGEYRNHETFRFDRNNQGSTGDRQSFVYQAYAESHDLFVGFGHHLGLAYSFDLAPRILTLRNWGYHHGADGWTAIPTQPIFRCERAR